MDRKDLFLKPYFGMLCLSVNHVYMRSYEVVLVLLSSIYMYRLVEPTATDSANWTNQIRSAKIAHKYDGSPFGN